MDLTDPFFARYNHKLNLYRDQAAAYYRGEELRMGAYHAMEREQYKGQVSRELEYLKQSGQYGLQGRDHSHRFDMQNREHSHLYAMQQRELNTRLDVEEKRGTLTRWVEEFRNNSQNRLETMRQSGTQQLQEREHLQQRMIYELEITEKQRAEDAAYMHQLQLAQRHEDLERYKMRCVQLYQLDEMRFDAMLTERKKLSDQFVAEFTHRNNLGANTNTALADMLATHQKNNNQTNQTILNAFLGNLAAQAESKRRMAELEHKMRLDGASEEAIRRAIDEAMAAARGGGY